MRKFLLRLRRKSVGKLKKQWENRLGNKSKTVPLAMLIGVAAAVAAGILHEFVAWLEHGGKYLQSRNLLSTDLIFILLPLFGIILSYLVQRNLGGNRYAKSLSPLILSLNRRRTSIPLRETFTHIISSAISVGCGGSAGLEAPSV